MVFLQSNQTRVVLHYIKELNIVSLGIILQRIPSIAIEILRLIQKLVISILVRVTICKIHRPTIAIMMKFGGLTAARGLI